ncbi:hypothetical protein PR003_g8946 [Phytophthora rubi]|uniref:Uncharacterized protein n=1 Tax=Phytophthora rubi TaxID=129364 RepID=A0A6A3MVW4_9STRA|nr:hypothetical protein PR002_g8725 [Phytophthora rubi]KAE9038309.1 hypothetical protein PR001_g8003 [Phytophthora rubi]KAE9343492.1 hypothetical protein PR003_g8946 [Phytophthora rubi]
MPSVAVGTVTLWCVRWSGIGCDDLTVSGENAETNVSLSLLLAQQDVQGEASGVEQLQ